MEKLTLEVLAPYLPYGLKIYWKESNDIYGITFEESVNYTDKLYPLSTLEYTMGTDLELGWTPILRPLSDLKLKDVEHIMNPLGYYCASNFDNELLFKRKNEQWCWVKDIRKVDEYLFKNHFDVFGLIDKGLAIDINTINS